MVGLFAGIERVGAPTASIVSTFEPVVTVVLAGLVLGESLTLVEAIGAACVIAAVRLLARGNRVPATEAEAEEATDGQLVAGRSTGG
jgi:drug/metabolite transporter (DMT)-like permease